MNNVREATGSQKIYWEQRDADPSLTKRGHAQAQKLADFLGDEERSQFLGVHPISELWVSPVGHPISALWVSPVGRFVMTMRIGGTTTC